MIKLGLFNGRILQYRQINQCDTPYKPIERLKHDNFDTGKAFNKIQHPFIIKTLKKYGHKRNLPQHSKGHI